MLLFVKKFILRTILYVSTQKTEETAAEPLLPICVKILTFSGNIGYYFD